MYVPLFLNWIISLSSEWLDRESIELPLSLENSGLADDDLTVGGICYLELVDGAALTVEESTEAIGDDGEGLITGKGVVVVLKRLAELGDGDMGTVSTSNAVCGPLGTNIIDGTNEVFILSGATNDDELAHGRLELATLTVDGTVEDGEQLLGGLLDTISDELISSLSLLKILADLLEVGVVTGCAHGGVRSDDLNTGNIGPLGEGAKTKKGIGSHEDSTVVLNSDYGTTRCHFV